MHSDKLLFVIGLKLIFDGLLFGSTKTSERHEHPRLAEALGLHHHLQGGKTLPERTILLINLGYLVRLVL